MIQKVKEIILDLCKKSTGFDWESHIRSVVKYSKLLAKQLGADEEICEIAAWLHDIKKIKGEKELHHVTGADEAEEILGKLKYDEDKTQQVKHCILTHSSDINYPPESKEAKIVASADAMSHFDNYDALSNYAYKVKKLSPEEGKKWLIEKYKKTWKKIIPEAQEIAKEKYKVIKLILSS